MTLPFKVSLDGVQVHPHTKFRDPSYYTSGDMNYYPATDRRTDSDGQCAEAQVGSKNDMQMPFTTDNCTEAYFNTFRILYRKYSRAGNFCKFCEFHEILEKFPVCKYSTCLAQQTCCPKMDLSPLKMVHFPVTKLLKVQICKNFMSQNFPVLQYSNAGLYPS